MLCIIVLVVSAVIAVITTIYLTKKNYVAYSDSDDNIILGFFLFGILSLVLGGISQVISSTTPSYCKRNLDFLKKEIQEVEIQIDAEQDSDSKWYLENVILKDKVEKANYYRKLIGMRLEE